MITFHEIYLALINLTRNEFRIIFGTGFFISFVVIVWMLRRISKTQKLDYDKGEPIEYYMQKKAIPLVLLRLSPFLIAIFALAAFLINSGFEVFEFTIIIVFALGFFLILVYYFSGKEKIQLYNNGIEIAGKFIYWYKIKEICAKEKYGPLPYANIELQVLKSMNTAKTNSVRLFPEDNVTYDQLEQALMIHLKHQKQEEYGLHAEDPKVNEHIIEKIVFGIFVVILLILLGAAYVFYVRRV